MKSKADGLRIAMWSGPRNISTALMRAWENRPDTAVIDEPFYAAYLSLSGVDHPGRDEILANHETDWRAVVAAITGPIPGGHAISYQKHMAHHMLPSVGREWLDQVISAFLIRDPRRVLASYARVQPKMTVEDLGFPQQLAMFERVRARDGRAPPVLDAADVLADPRGTLEALCAAVGVPFSDRMLSWPAGRRDSDGVWAKHWYASVERSTGFAPEQRSAAPLPDHLEPLAAACEPFYRGLHEHRLRP